MAKQILRGEEARQEILKGVNAIADVVGSTLGPRGTCVLIQRQYGPPFLSKDGVTAARETVLKDPIQNIGAQMLREVASRTVEEAGDGTSSSTVIARAIYKEGVKLIAAGANPAALKRGVDKTVEAIVGKKNETTGKYEGGAIQAISVPVSGNMIASVGRISANGDEEIGNLLAEAMDRVGNSGLITLDRSSTLENKLEVVDGMQFDRGYVHGAFVTNPERREAVLSRSDDTYVYVLVIDKKLTALSDIKALFDNPNALQRDTRPFLVIAEDIEGEALHTLLINKTRGILECCAVKGPGFGDRRRAMLEDIAILTGATLISDDTGKSLDKITLADLGKAKRISVTATNTTIVGGLGDPTAIESRVAELKSLIDAAETDFEREKFRERLAKLTSGVAVIRLGAATDSEFKEKNDRAEDALHATRAAAEEGIVPGGGTALIRCYAAAAAVALSLPLEEQMGANIILAALSSPLYQIVQNAGLKGDVIVRDVQNHSGNWGYNAATWVYEDLVGSGVIDPSKVVRVALQNASSIAGLLLTTDSILCEVPDPLPAFLQGQQ